LSACVEFIHTATLLHDDVVDDSSLRRGLASANALFGNKPSVLVGIFCSALLRTDGRGRLAASAADSVARLVGDREGEVLQLITANDTSTSEDAYLE